MQKVTYTLGILLVAAALLTGCETSTAPVTPATPANAPTQTAPQGQTTAYPIPADATPGAYPAPQQAPQETYPAPTP